MSTAQRKIIISSIPVIENMFSLFQITHFNIIYHIRVHTGKLIDLYVDKLRCNKYLLISSIPE